MIDHGSAGFQEPHRDEDHADQERNGGWKESRWFRALHAAVPFYAILVSAVYITETTLHPTLSWIVSTIGICVITVVILDRRLQARRARANA